MRLLKTIALFILLSSSAIAGEANQYNDLEKKFKEAQSISFDRSLGWYSGRCFKKTGGSFPQVLMNFMYKIDHGPLFSHHIVKKSLVYGELGPSGMFDELTEKNRLKIKSHIKKTAKYSENIIQNQDRVLSIYLNNDDDLIRMEIKRFDNFIITSSQLEDWQELGVTHYCYFFKKINDQGIYNEI